MDTAPAPSPSRGIGNLFHDLDLENRYPLSSFWIGLPPAARKLRAFALRADVESDPRYPQAARRAVDFACRLVEQWSLELGTQELGKNPLPTPRADGPPEACRLLSEACALSLELGDVAAARLLAFGLSGYRPARREGLLLQGLVEFAVHRFDFAEAHYRDAVAAGPEHEGAYLYLAAALHAQGRSGEARVVASEALRERRRAA